MGLEEEMFKLFGDFSAFGKGKTPNIETSRLVMSMLRRMEVDMLRKVRSQIDNLISKSERERQTAWKTEGIPYGSTTDYGDLDPFKILDVDMNATFEQARSAYRKKASKAHPDAGGTHEDMVKVNAAWQAMCMFKGWYG